ncbi:MAG: DUF1611 domain-containing protein [Parasphingorhabdus sp.]
MYKIKTPYLLYLGQGDNPLTIKTSRGIAHWRPELCVGEMGSPLTLGLPKMSATEAVRNGAKTFVLGLTSIENSGNVPDAWVTDIRNAIDAGMDIANGLHERLINIAEVKNLSITEGVSLHDVRHQVGRLPLGTGQKRSGKRILTVGTDCSVGKMYTALAIEEEMRRQKFSVDFRATGQTGILIAGQGTPVDAVVADFVAGAVEMLCPANSGDHWDVIEGQGSLFNPAYAGVSLGLLHGAQADLLVMCHEADRREIKDKPGYPIPDVKDCIETNLKLARLTNPKVQLGAISLNCRLVDAEKVNDRCKRLSDAFGVPCFDSVLHGAGDFVVTLK